MVNVGDHKGGTIMKPFNLILLFSPCFVAINLTLPLIHPSGESVIKIPSLVFVKRNM